MLIMPAYPTGERRRWMRQQVNDNFEDTPDRKRHYIATNALSDLKPGRYTDSIAGYIAAAGRDKELYGILTYRVPCTADKVYGLLRVYSVATSGTVKGAGVLLMRQAAEYARQHSMGLLLAARPESKAFYKRIGMHTMYGETEGIEIMWMDREETARFAKEGI